MCLKKAVNDRNYDDQSTIKIRPVWSKHGKNLRLLSNISFEVKIGREFIGENYGITNQIFTTKNEKIEINLEKSNNVNEGFAFGVKSELENSQATVTNLICPLTSRNLYLLTVGRYSFLARTGL